MEAAQNLHKMLLEALRHREEQIIRFIAILAPALGGFTWLLQLDDNKSANLYAFGFGTIGVLFLLTVGAIYSVALGYNYRCITLQVSKLEAALNIREFVLNGWPQKPCDFQKQYCVPPETIKVFWWAFNIGIIAVATAAIIRVRTGNWANSAYPWVIAILVIASVCEAGGWLMPIFYGAKLKKLYEKEPVEWKPVK